LTLAVPLSRFTPRAGGGSAFYVSKFAPMNTKLPIIEFFAEHLPQYTFVPGLGGRSSLMFRLPQPNGIYRYIAICRQPAPYSILTDAIAATYHPAWRGESAMPIGISISLAELRAGKRCLEAEKYWTSYKPTLEGLHEALCGILNDFARLSPAFFEQTEHQLLSSRLLQIALAESRRIPAAERAGLTDASAATKFLQNLEHPTFLRLRDVIRAAWTPDMPKEERQATSKLAYVCLELPSA
jgi:hypothetical protein